MQLCSNRPEGFGPHSTLHPSLPTTCFQDVILIPLITWLYLLAALPLLILSSTLTTPPPKPTPDPSPRTKRWRTILWTVYAFLIIALLAMLSLEIARLRTADLGIGLLPFTYVGILIAVGVHAINTTKSKSRRYTLLAKGANGLFWVLLAVVIAIKVATYVKEGVNSRDGMVPADRYGVADEVTDTAVMIFLVVVLAVVELVWF